jgi:transcriptional regulator with XRE-family HTH domain
VTSQFSVLLRQLRRQTELTQEDLAERTGLSVRTIRRLETGASTNPQFDTVRLLADALSLESADRAQMLAVADGQVPPVETPLPPSEFERRLAEAGDDLAHAVGARLGREEELRRIQDPFPLPVRWQMAPDDLMDHWENIRRVEPGASAKALNLAGRLPDIADIYRRIPSGRLVVLGRAGSGKSVLAARFVLDLLRTRERGDAVPVVFSVASWNPTTTSFRDWVAGQLTRDHPGLADANLAADLVEAGRILPVLDGFDELAAGLHRAAVDSLNATTFPLLLTSRPGEYATVARTDALTAAAAVRLTDLTVTDLGGYLPRTTRKTGGATVWDPVLKELRDHPRRPASMNLRAVLTTPLMVGLARAIYSDPGRDPAELLDTDRFASQYDLEDHLLGSFIPTVYQDEAERARRWLGYLARHLDRLGTHDIAWWQLGSTISRGMRMLVVGLLSGLAIGLVTGLLIGPVNSIAGGSGMVGVIAMFGNWLGFGLALGLAHGAGITLGGGAFEPSRVRLRTRGGARQLRAKFVPRTLTGLVGGTGLGIVLGLACVAGLDPMGLVDFGFLGGLATGAGLGLLTGVGWGLMAGFEAPVDIRSAVGPTDLLQTNRGTVVVEFLGWGLVLAVAHLLLLHLLAGPVHPMANLLDLVLGPVIGLVVGTCLTAWGQWVLFARIWLPLTGRLPWAVAAFLDDACRQGVLRQAGAVYQFRHSRLQAQLLD